MHYTLSVLVENQFGVLARIAGLFSARGFNIVSLSVAETEDPTISVMTIVVDGDNRVVDQVKKQLNKLIEVIKVRDLTDEEYVERELALIKVGVNAAKRREIIEIADVFKGKVVDISHTTITIEVTGSEEKVDAIIELLKSYGIIEMARTGKIALLRG
ncbi:acetolactate synthase small subunit [Thermospira aquatica]|uniref:Acetolactate synthase small subunit n=1 Tax=Thermospira aquatica TaxID=2828656 RepID=A0AAX3BDX2_9SPIR|nr:acetolactate synthase small subunit [Thermospira aquatica]URA10489.1 acetolactate synthase small subunit [Thermospira aquatica]